MVPAYYNPAEPQDSVLNRDFRPEIILLESAIAIVFALIGGGLMLLGWRGQKINTAADLEREPWKVNADWQGGPIFSHGKLGLVVTILFAVAWNFTTWLTMWIIGPSLIDQRNPFGLLLVGFSVIALYLIYKSIQSGMRWRRFGRTPLYLDPFPGQLGGVVRGYILINQMLMTDSDVNVSVVAMCRKRSNKRTSETPVWQRSRTGSIEVSATGCRVRFDVPIEDNLPSTNYPTSKHTGSRRGARVSHHWQLRLEHVASGLDRVFAIPVYEVEPDQLVESARSVRELARP